MALMCITQIWKMSTLFFYLFFYGLIILITCATSNHSDGDNMLMTVINSDNNMDRMSNYNSNYNYTKTNRNNRISNIVDPKQCHHHLLLIMNWSHYITYGLSIICTLNYIFIRWHEIISYGF